MLPWRFAILADGAAAALLVFALDRAWAAVPRDADQEARPAWTQRAAWWPRAAFTAVAVLAVLPLVPLPYKAAPVPQPPAGWSATFATAATPRGRAGSHPAVPIRRLSRKHCGGRRIPISRAR